jgi:hypothetical protein
MAVCLFGFLLMLSGVVLNRFSRYPVTAFLIACTGSTIIVVSLVLDVWQTIAGHR